ncbi:MAG: cryptochrome/photolyase family protein, partial [Ignavibacteria bacterium]|nr:cryptochrome/photolyase family protein [Ignavibacteria bacterium]
MSEVALIFPHQMFKHHPALQKNRQVFLVEEWLFFRNYNFHQQKIILHRSGMKFYEAYLKEQNFTVQYIETTDERNDVRKLIEFLSQQNINIIHIADVVDYWLNKRIVS